jgi:ribonuclease BN (tRNA processing enzyme)
MLKFQVIGCSSGFPHKSLACSAYLLKHNKRRILFDCGEGATSAMRRLNIDPRSIETIFISHMHADHCMGLPLFIQTNYVLRRTGRLDLFVPSEAVSGIRKLFDLTYLYPLKIPFEMEVHGVTADTSFEMTGLAVRPYPNTHLQRHKRALKGTALKNRMQSFCYSIEAEGKRIVYSADLGSERDLADAIQGCDLLIVEQSHVDLGKLRKMLLNEHISELIITHLDEDVDLAGTKRLLSGTPTKRIKVAREGLEITLR